MADNGTGTVTFKLLFVNYKIICTILFRLSIVFVVETRGNSKQPSSPELAARLDQLCRLWYLYLPYKQNNFLHVYTKMPVKLQQSCNFISMIANCESIYQDCHTRPIAEILCVKNGRVIVVSWFLMKESQKKKYAESLKKIVGAVWELPAK